VVRDVAGVATSGLSLGDHVASAGLANFVGGLVTSTVATPFGAPHTRFNTKLGPRRAFAATSLNRNRIRAIQDAAEVTGNDVVTALVTGVLRAWLRKQDELPAQSPTAVEDPAERLHLVHYAMSNVKHQVAANGPGAMLIVLMPAVVPTVLAPLGSTVKPSYNLPISNVPGPQKPSYFNGASVDEIYPVSVAYDGMALNVTLCSYAHQIGVGFIADRDVLADVDDLVPLTETALAELEAAGGLA
jgi:hypothetical protein